MKKTLYTLLFLSLSLSYSQLDEGQRINFDFIKVEKENIEEYESFITDYIGKVAETAVENGKLENFILNFVESINSMKESAGIDVNSCDVKFVNVEWETLYNMPISEASTISLSISVIKQTVPENRAR